MAWLLLVNGGKQSVTIWDYQNCEGAQCPGVILTDEKGKETVLRPAAMARAAGIPTVVNIEPQQVIRIELELLRLMGEHGLPPGRYKLKGFYENKEKNDSPFIKKEVWMGGSRASRSRLPLSLRSGGSDPKESQDEPDCRAIHQ